VQRIAEALRAAGLEVWFDREELRGGDAWDRHIRERIHDCQLFVPVISANTEARDEGYFRREWKLAVDRTHDMAEKRTFLVPVVIDNTTERGASVPDKFREVQWTRLPTGDTPPAFVQRVQRLLAPHPSTTSPPATNALPTTPALREPLRTSWRSATALLGIGAVLVAAFAYLLVERPWTSKHLAAHRMTSAASAPAEPAGAPAFTPPPHSIAVLPFVNMSGDKEQEYFSDGLTEELLNSLARINDLQVSARTSSFYFKGEHADLPTIARKLNVASVLEGSVRRSGHTIRVTAQLNNAVTGFHLWSETYDRDLGDVLKLQTDIANAVASALKITLLSDVATTIELGGTHNPAAFDAYLRASKAYQSRHEAKDIPSAITAFTEAIRLDPRYALAIAGRSNALTAYTADVATGAAIREGFEKAEGDARRAIALAPELAEAHLALAYVLSNGFLDFAQAREEYEQALALAPGNAQVLRGSGHFAAYMGHFDAAITALRRAVVLDPLARTSYTLLGRALYAARRYREAATALADVIALSPEVKPAYGQRGLAFYGLGELQSARDSCETQRDYWVSRQCLAVVYDKLGRHSDAEAELKKYQAAEGDAAAYQYATIYAQWGDQPKALEWLDTAMRLRDPGLLNLKTDPLLDPLRTEPRFQAIERTLKFAD